MTDREAEYSQLLTETTYKQLLGSEVQTGHKTYIYGKGLIGSKDGSSLENLYYHYNNIGSTTEITSDEGVTIYRFAYDTYGELLSDREDIRFLYNGQFGIETEDNGLYYMRARYYNPQIKRFINRDVLEGDITDSQTLNRYSYVLGNPVSLTDPFGLCASNYSEEYKVMHGDIKKADMYCWSDAKILIALTEIIAVLQGSCFVS